MLMKEISNTFQWGTSPSRSAQTSGPMPQRLAPARIPAQDSFGKTTPPKTPALFFGAQMFKNSIQSIRDQGILVLGREPGKASELSLHLQQEAMNPKLAGVVPGPIPACGLVLEDSTSDVLAKRTLLRTLNTQLAADKIIATHPQGQRLQDLVGSLTHPERFVGVRFLSPAHKNKLVELMPGPLTHPDVLEKTRQLLRATGKVTVTCAKDSPGGLTDRLQRHMQMEALRLLQEGWGSAKEIDAVTLRLLGKKSENPKQQRLGELPLLKNLVGQKESLYNTVKSMSTLGPLYTVPALLEAEYTRLNAPGQKAVAFFSEGLPTPETANSNRPKDERVKMIEARLAGSLLANALQMLQEGLCQPEDLETAARVGLSWQTGPFAAMNALNEKNPALVETALKTYLQTLGKEAPKITPPTAAWDLWGIKSETKNDVCTITMDRPFELNTLRTEALERIIAALEKAEKDPEVQVIVLASNSGKVFSGGADLIMFRDAPSVESFKNAIILGKNLINRIATSSKLTIAKVQGPTYGASTELALGFDRLVVADDFTMKLPEVNIGLAPVWGGTERMIQKLGRPMAKALILNGKFEHGLVPHLPKMLQKLVNGPLNLDVDRDPGFAINAKAAKTLGLVDAVAPRQFLDDALEALLQNPEMRKKPDSNRGLKQYPTIESYPEEIQEAYRLKDIEAETAKDLGRYSKRSRPLAIRLMDQVGTEKEGYLSDDDYKQITEDTQGKIRKIYMLKDMAMALKDKKVLSFFKHFYDVLTK